MNPGSRHRSELKEQQQKDKNQTDRNYNHQTFGSP